MYWMHVVHILLQDTTSSEGMTTTTSSEGMTTTTSSEGMTTTTPSEGMTTTTLSEGMTSAIALLRIGSCGNSKRSCFSPKGLILE